MRRYKRCRAHDPHGYRNTTTAIAAPGTEGIIAPRILDGAMNGDRFGVLISGLVKSLRPGDIAVCDNPAAHKVSGVRGLLRKAKVRLLFPPRYSPGITPVEQAISQRRSFLGKVAARTREDTDVTIRESTKV